MSNYARRARNQERGRRAASDGSAFEAEIGVTFEPYADAGIAIMDFMPVPMYPVNQRGGHGQRLYAPRGKAPFDVYGYLMLDGRFIGAEIKESRKKPSLSIVMPGKLGDGLQFHQLDALNTVACNHGIARLVWNNGGAVGVIREDKIRNAWSGAWTAVTLEERGKNVARGLKSIKWEQFEPVVHRNIGGRIVHDWLMEETLHVSGTIGPALNVGGARTGETEPAAGSGGVRADRGRPPEERPAIGGNA